jgi:type IV pilus assembly protein PilX
MYKVTHNKSFSPNHQRGAVLIISLIMLLVLTLLGVSSMRTTILEEKMAGNLRDKNTSFQAAETALRDGEALLETLLATSSFDGTDGRMGSSDDDPNFFATNTWSDTNATSDPNYVGSIDYSGTMSGVAAQPQYIVKFVKEVVNDTGSLKVGGYGDSGTNSVNNFRVTAKGVGQSESSSTILQAYYGKAM